MLCDRCRIIRKSAFVNGKSDTFKYMRICRYYFSALNNYYIIRNKSRRRISFAYSSFSPIGAPPRTWKCR